MLAALSQLCADTYQIAVRGNAYTSPERAQNIALLRAACDTAINAGYDRFILLGGNVQSQVAGSTIGTASIIGKTILYNPARPGR
jgi:hypothetical protein